jgi:DNA-binding transcriptional ArsR family regulator
MAHSKANRYELECQILNHFFRAISHPARQKIIKKLRKDEPCRVTELSKNHPISRATFSDHLKILTEAHMILGKEEFPYTYYSLNKARLLEAKKIINDFFDSLDL